MLQDGLDALSDRQPDLARQLFEQLVSTFPGTPEAQRAVRELSLLGGSAVASTGDARPDRVQRAGGDEPASRGTAALRRAFVTEIGDRVFFAENSSNIGGRARAMLENQARWLKARPGVLIKIIGRADDGGSPQSAKDLASRRAETVRDQLVANGIGATRVKIEARGDSDPLTTCRTFMCQAQNRLAETLIVEPLPSAAGDTRDSDAAEDGEAGDRENGEPPGAAATDVTPRATVAR